MLSNVAVVEHASAPPFTHTIALSLNSLQGQVDTVSETMRIALKLKPKCVGPTPYVCEIQPLVVVRRSPTHGPWTKTAVTQKVAAKV